MESRPSSERLRSPPTLRQMDDRSQSGRAPGCCSLRLGLALLLHFCNVSMMSQRACLSLTMVAMVNGTGPQELPNASTPEPLDDPRNPVYNWSPRTQGIVLSSSTYGMLLSQVPVGYLSGIYPVKNMVGSALLLSSLLSLLVPLAAGVGASAVIACRVAQGLSQGTVLVAQHTVWTKWAPLSERGRLTSLSLSGLMLGPSLALCVTGLICQALGWPMVFYVFERAAVRPPPSVLLAPGHPRGARVRRLPVQKDAQRARCPKALHRAGPPPACRLRGEPALPGPQLPGHRHMPHAGQRHPGLLRRRDSDQPPGHRPQVLRVSEGSHGSHRNDRGTHLVHAGGDSPRSGPGGRLGHHLLPHGGRQREQPPLLPGLRRGRRAGLGPGEEAHPPLRVSGGGGRGVSGRPP
ncbi:sodium-dependent phosphate transport protein 1 isoform X7 [Pipistrellus kuhlii]|uniref:sodium-dependent phosphate transport protein 1 isoform X7 n=1 Tax=Pipistrellus kuhlii TaxID=59472 RepID=UPI001E26F869|nr:sodium-dependent phosphate transport protein 1 isoform X7 [Pipistrellus kuhlii]